MSTDVQYRDVKRTAVELAVSRLHGLTISVGFQGRTGHQVAKVRRGVEFRKRNDGGTDRRYKRRRTALADSKLRMVDLATIHIFGAPRAGIPARDFMRPPFAREATTIQAKQREIVKGTLKGQDPTRGVLRLGLWLEGLIKREITDLREPPLAASTILKRWRATGDANPNPLIDKGHLRASITHVVLRHGFPVGGSDGQ